MEARLKAAMDARVAAGEVTGAVALVVRDGATSVAAAGHMTADGDAPMTRDTIFRIASITKPMTAATAMVLVQEGRLDLDAPVDRLLPELAAMRVVARPDGPLSETVPLERPITARHLLSQTFGLGFLMPGTPLAAALGEAGLAPGPEIPDHDGDAAYLARLASLPLAAQPGHEWFYQTGLEVAGVLVARAGGGSLDQVMRSRLFDPLGMVDTGFSVTQDKLARLPPLYVSDPQSGVRGLFDPGGAASRFARAAAFQTGAAGLASTVDDVAAFGRMMLDGKSPDGRQIVSRDLLAQMTRDHLTDRQRASAEMFLDGAGWGLGMAVPAGDGGGPKQPRGYGWDGGYGTSWRTDPDRDLVGVMLTQQLWNSPTPPAVLDAFWSTAYG